MSVDRFTYWMPTNIHFAKQAVYQMQEFIEGENILIVVSKTLYNNGTAKAIANSLLQRNIAYYSNVEADPSTECVDDVVAKAREIKATTIIGIGGGSVLDVCKAVACLTTSSGCILDYLTSNENKPLERDVKLILVPTTAGTGSEVTNIAVFMDKAQGKKIPMVNDQFYADIAIIDPMLTYTTPPNVTANTGMDALCHALESYWNANSNPISDVLAIQAITLIFVNMKKAYDNPNDGEARCNMMLAALLAGLAFAQTRTTGAHALSYPLSSMYHIPHGVSCAISLPAFIRLSHELKETKMKELEAVLGFKDEIMFADAVENLLQDVKMPTRLSQIGASESEIEQITKDAMNYQKQLDLSPTEMNYEKLHKLICSIL